MNLIKYLLPSGLSFGKTERQTDSKSTFGLHVPKKDKKSIQKFVFPGLLLVLLLGGCCKDDPGPSLPPETQVGANTFGCKINGKIWLPSVRKNSPIPGLRFIEGGIVERYIETGPEINWFDLLIFAFEDSKVTFQLYLRRINGTGTYTMTYRENVFPGCIDCSNHYAYFRNGNENYSALTLLSSQIVLTRYDTINKIFSGTFSFKARNHTGRDTVEITEGRFDIDQKVIN